MKNKTASALLLSGLAILFSGCAGSNHTVSTESDMTPTDMCLLQKSSAFAKENGATPDVPYTIRGKDLKSIATICTSEFGEKSKLIAAWETPKNNRPSPTMSKALQSRLTETDQCIDAKVEETLDAEMKDWPETDKIVVDGQRLQIIKDECSAKSGATGLNMVGLNAAERTNTKSLTVTLKKQP